MCMDGASFFQAYSPQKCRTDRKTPCPLSQPVNRKT